MTVETIVKYDWIRGHPWIAWPLWGVTGVCAFMAARETQWFRCKAQNVFAKIVPPPRSTPDSHTTAMPATSAEPKITVRITKGFFSGEVVNGSIALLLHVHVAGEPAVVKTWGLQLLRGAEHWVWAPWQAMANGQASYGSGSKAPAPVVSVNQISEYLPSDGWLLFFVPLFGARPEELLGATFVLTAIETGAGTGGKGEIKGEPKGPSLEFWLNEAFAIWPAAQS